MKYKVTITLSESEQSALLDALSKGKILARFSDLPIDVDWDGLSKTIKENMVVTKCCETCATCKHNRMSACYTCPHVGNQ